MKCVGLGKRRQASQDGFPRVSRRLPAGRLRAATLASPASSKGWRRTRTARPRSVPPSLLLEEDVPRMKTLGAIALAAVFALSLGAACAAPAPRSARQSPARPAAQPGPRFAAQLNQLNLTPAQRSQVDKVLSDLRAEMASIRQSTTDPQTRREKMRAATMEARNKISAILTPAQRARWQQLSRQGGGGFEMLAPSTLARELNLTAQQQQKVRPILEKYSKAMADLRASTVPPAQRRGKMLSLRNDLQADLAKVLTPQQQTRLRSLMERRGGGGLGVVGNVDMLARRLNLTPDQRRKAQQLVDQARAAADKLRAQAATGGANRQQIRQKLMDLRAKTTASLRSILTEQQRQQFDQMVKQQRAGARPGGARSAGGGTPPAPPL